MTPSDKAPAMDWVIIAGALSLGVILGWMGYIVFVSQSNIKTLIAIVGLFGGAVVVGIFQAIAGTKAALPREVWFYPVGLLAGIAFAAAIAARFGQRRQTRLNLGGEELQEEYRPPRSMLGLATFRRKNQQDRGFGLSRWAARQLQEQTILFRRVRGGGR